jgi:hypothetical protein
LISPQLPNAVSVLGTCDLKNTEETREAIGREVWFLKTGKPHHYKALPRNSLCELRGELSTLIYEPEVGLHRAGAARRQAYKSNRATEDITASP